MDRKKQLQKLNEYYKVSLICFARATQAPDPEDRTDYWKKRCRALRHIKFIKFRLRHNI